jgi:hypothetical protein
MPGLEPGIQAAPFMLIRVRRSWMHGSSPCVTEGDHQNLITYC